MTGKFLRIGVDATCWQNSRGYGRHARSLLSALIQFDTNNQYTFFFDTDRDSLDLPDAVAVEVVGTDVPTTVAAAADGRRSVRDIWKMSRALSRAQVDLLIFPTAYSFVPVLSPAKKLLFIHDIIAESYPAFTLPSRSSRFFWHTKLAIGRRQADALVTVSHYAREGIASQFNIDPERIFIVGEANDPIFEVLDEPEPTPNLLAQDICRDRRYVVFVGGFGPHKNLEMLIDVFQRVILERGHEDVDLILVGDYSGDVFHSQFEQLRARVAAADLVDRVKFTGYLPDEDLVVLLNFSDALVLPSLMEGFGLPAVEAAACGCPVIATTESPLPELLGTGGRYIDPGSPQELFEALVAVLDSAELRRQMAAAGLAAASTLTWRSAADQLMRVMEHICA